MLELKDLNFNFPNKVLLKHINLELISGDYALLTGKNGSGKSTLFQIMIAYRQASSGRILFQQQNLAIMPQKQRAQLIAYVPQHFRININIKVKEFLDLAFYPFNQQQRTKLYDWKSFMINQSQLADLLELRIDQLSMGQQRKVAIIAALIVRPAILLLDESFSFLDQEQAALIKNLLTTYQHEHKSIILESSHEEVVHKPAANKYFLLLDGVLQPLDKHASANPSELSSDHAI